MYLGVGKSRRGDKEMEEEKLDWLYPWAYTGGQDEEAYAVSNLAVNDYGFSC